ncbi:hypothetical protein EYF80_001152 [Liparis tanakae]|uniref:Uncharacterized protein n=1 Tax=Liparis tanakae TaxID=230148 RepID=A0A4Z2JDX3_9TELE|nr:hypothetical protein EYF80_001152 [Liparis tanakae]
MALIAEELHNYNNIASAKASHSEELHHKEKILQLVHGDGVLHGPQPRQHYAAVQLGFGLEAGRLGGDWGERGESTEDVRRRPVPHRGEAQHPEAVGDVGSQARDGRQAAVVGVVLLPGAERSRLVRAVVDPVAPDLPVGLLGRLPLHQHRAGAQHARLDVQRWRGGGLFAGARLHGVALRPAADVVDSHDAELVLGVGAQATDAVSGRGHAFHLLEAVVRGLGSVLDHVVGDGLWVPRVPASWQRVSGPPGFLAAALGCAAAVMADHPRCQHAASSFLNILRKEEEEKKKKKEEEKKKKKEEEKKKKEEEEKEEEEEKKKKKKEEEEKKEEKKKKEEEGGGGRRQRNTPGLGPLLAPHHTTTVITSVGGEQPRLHL